MGSSAPLGVSPSRTDGLLGSSLGHLLRSDFGTPERFSELLGVDSNTRDKGQHLRWWKLSLKLYGVYNLNRMSPGPAPLEQRVYVQG